MSADVLGISCEGENVEDSIFEFKKAILCKIEEEVGGIFLKPSSFKYLMKDAQDFVNMLKDDGIEVHAVTQHTVAF